MPTGIRRIDLEETSSTNDVCLEEITNSDEPIIITSDIQTKGRGRNQKEWDSPKGNLYYSFGFTTRKLIDGLSVKVGLLAAEVLIKILNKNVLLKWPNDLFYQKKKVGGILVESASHNKSLKIVVGIGINLKNKKVNNFWGDLDIQEDITKIREAIITSLSKELAVFIDNDLDNSWNKRWMDLCIHNNKKIILESNQGEVLFTGINSKGQLIGKGKNNKIVTISESSITIKT
jgi:BirA family biotin operon repressor/biotin-[acetyl-CoA-carboxylase] ligase|tara:strand:- start:452 stop:1147 length:696 start_codon:yes stop_codon:yes gene_type:complete